MSLDVEFTDRYEALGITPPRVFYCRGQCEATGWVPVFVAEADRRTPRAARMVSEHDPALLALWWEAERAEPTDDGWHFVRCPRCRGTGRARGLWARIDCLAHFAERQWAFARDKLFTRDISWHRTDRSWWWNRWLVVKILCGWRP